MLSIGPLPFVPKPRIGFYDDAATDGRAAVGHAAGSVYGSDMGRERQFQVMPSGPAGR